MNCNFGITTMSSSGAMSLPRGDTSTVVVEVVVYLVVDMVHLLHIQNLLMDYVQIATTGIGYDLGDLTTTGTVNGGTASSTRGLFLLVEDLRWHVYTYTIQYVTISSTGTIHLWRFNS